MTEVTQAEMEAAEARRIHSIEEVAEREEKALEALRPLNSHPKLHLVARGVDLKVNMGDGPATPSAGFSRAEIVDRVGKRSMTALEGPQPFQQDVPILLDGFRHEKSVQKQLDELLSLGQIGVFKAYGPIFRSGERFIFGDEPEFGEMLRGTENDREALVRCSLTLKLMEYVPADDAGRRRKQRDPRGNPDKSGGVAFPGSIYRVHTGDTLTKIAAKLYGDAHLWKKIGELNKIRDPNKKLKPGRVLKLPGSYPEK